LKIGARDIEYSLMRIYLDACCLNRPLDDQSQERIRLESEAVRLIIESCGGGTNRWVCSDAIEFEIRRNPDEEHRSIVLAMLRFADERLNADEASTSLARSLAQHGIGAMDALHLALAETSGCDVLLTTDDDFLRRSAEVQPPLRIRVENPARWVLETARNGA
jgi:predicted nucleic acid-binding protein